MRAFLLIVLVIVLIGIYALQYRKPRNAIALIENGADVNVATEEGWMPIHYAAYYGYLEVMELLIKNGADPHQLLGDDDTPLQIARYKKHDKVVKLLERY